MQIYKVKRIIFLEYIIKIVTTSVDKSIITLNYKEIYKNHKRTHFTKGIICMLNHLKTLVDMKASII